MLIHINGWPGVGKLTIARRLAELIDGAAEPAAALAAWLAVVGAQV